jgi:hypothetical protein
MNKISTFPSSPLSQYPVGTWRRGFCETVSITTLVLWNCNFALPVFPSSPCCLNTRLYHDVTTVKLYLLLHWYCETEGLPYQHSLLPLVSIPGRNMTWLLWNCTYYYAGTMKLLLCAANLMSITEYVGADWSYRHSHWYIKIIINMSKYLNNQSVF